jgi:hypothetical protein
MRSNRLVLPANSGSTPQATRLMATTDQIGLLFPLALALTALVVAAQALPLLPPQLER